MLLQLSIRKSHQLFHCTILHTHTHTHSLSDGVGRTGTFICIHAQVERLKTEGVVDFFQSIKSARIQRAGLVPDVVSPNKTSFLSHSCKDCSFLSVSTFSVTMWWLTILMDLILMPTSRNSSNKHNIHTVNS